MEILSVIFLTVIPCSAAQIRNPLSKKTPKKKIKKKRKHRIHALLDRTRAAVVHLNFRVG